MPALDPKYNSEWEKKNRVRRNQYRKEWRRDNANHCKAYLADYRAKNRERINRQKRESYARKKQDPSWVARKNAMQFASNNKNPQTRLAIMLRTRIYRALNCKNAKRAYKSIKLLGASISKVKKHLESLFQEGMTWDNHGKWHIDHKIPIKYDNPTLDEQKERLHYLNLQPLWAEENISKGNRYCD